MEYNKFEIISRTGGSWIEVSEYIFRSWSGPRRLNGVEWVGPVYLLGTDTPVQSART